MIDPQDEEDLRVETSRLRAHAADIDRKNGTNYVLATVWGRKFVWDVLSTCGVLNASFNTEPLLMAFNEGKRDIGMRLLIMLETDRPGILQDMRAEDIARSERYEKIAAEYIEPEELP